MLGTTLAAVQDGKEVVAPGLALCGECLAAFGVDLVLLDAAPRQLAVQAFALNGCDLATVVFSSLPVRLDQILPSAQLRLGGRERPKIVQHFLADLAPFAATLDQVVLGRAGPGGFLADEHS